MNQSLTTLARHNFASLCTLARFLERRGYWTTKRDIAADVAEAVHGLFESLAWADRKLDAGECWLLDAVLEEDESHGAHLKECIARGGAQSSIPGCLAAAALHDSVHGTCFADLLLNHLENLGRLIIMSDSKLSADELRAYRSYFEQLRGSIAAPPEAGAQ